MKQNWREDEVRKKQNAQEAKEIKVEIEKARYQNILVIEQLEKAEVAEYEYEERIKALDSTLQEKEEEEHLQLKQTKGKLIDEEHTQILEKLLGESTEKRINKEKEWIAQKEE